MNYVPLHVHSDASLLDGLSKPTQIARRCESIGIASCALTDHGNLANSISFTTAMQKRKLKPILGCELYVCPRDATIKDGDRTLHHLVVLAKNLDGWKQLVRLVSSSNHPDHFYYKPRLDIGRIAEYADGNLIAFSGHLGSTLSHCIFSDLSGLQGCVSQEATKQYIHKDWVSRTINEAERLRDIFGRGNFFLEVQLMDGDSMPAHKMLVMGLRYVSKQTGIPCIATPDAHYANKEDAVDQRVLLCSNMKTTFAEVNAKLVSGDDVGMGAFFRSRNYYIPSGKEMLECGHTEEELENTVRVAELCETYKLTNPPNLPKFSCPDGLTSEQYMVRLLREGWEYRFPQIQRVIKEGRYTEDDYKARLNEECKILTDVGLADYFLIVHDIINFARSRGQLTGCGRGSAAGSMVLYMLKVTEVDPLQYGLLFSRFFNAGRMTEGHVSLPDVDMDFERSGRKEVIDYLRSKYGHDKVAQMLTFTRLQGRAAMKEVVRVHGAMSFDEVNRITEFIPDEAEISDKLQDTKEEDEKAGGDGNASIITWALENHADELREWAYLDNNGNLQGPYAKVFEQAVRIEGTKKAMSKHAAGVIISNEPLADVCPMVYDKTTKEMICGMSMEDLEAIGLVKIDVLGVSFLDKVHGVTNLLKCGELCVSNE